VAVSDGTDPAGAGSDRSSLGGGALASPGASGAGAASAGLPGVVVTAPSQPPAGLSPTAQQIISDARSGPGSPGDRAVALVWAIINAYFRSQAGLVSSVVFTPELVSGLLTDVRGNGPQVTGKIEVSPEFLNRVRQLLAHRILQVAHELEHVQQHRQGLAGAQNTALREFLAFAHEAFAQPPAGTGEVYHSTRIKMIDEALQNYAKMSPDQQAAQAGLKQRLIAERARQVALAALTP
jgi:hypothetical protein